MQVGYICTILDRRLFNKVQYLKNRNFLHSKKITVKINMIPTKREIIVREQTK